MFCETFSFFERLFISLLLFSCDFLFLCLTEKAILHQTHQNHQEKSLSPKIFLIITFLIYLHSFKTTCGQYFPSSMRAESKLIATKQIRVVSTLGISLSGKSALSLLKNLSSFSNFSYRQARYQILS